MAYLEKAVEACLGLPEANSVAVAVQTAPENLVATLEGCLGAVSAGQTLDTRHCVPKAA